MADGIKRTIKITAVDERPWQKPGSNKWYHTIAIEGFTSEPIKFIQDKDKNAPAPEVDKEFTGLVYSGDKGYTFYPELPRKSGWAGDKKPQTDSYTMYLSYAKDIAVAMIARDGFNREKFLEICKNVKAGGDVLFEGKDSLKVPESAPNNWEQARQKLHKEDRDEDNQIKNQLEEPINLDDIPF